MSKKIKYMSDSGVLENSRVLDEEGDVSDHQQEDSGQEHTAGIALISDGQSETVSCDDTVEDTEDDDFYNDSEFYDESYGEGGPDTGF